MQNPKEISEINGIEGIPWEIDFALSAYKLKKYTREAAVKHIGCIINTFSGFKPEDSRGTKAAISFIEYVELVADK